MAASPAEIEREADASRERLASTLDDLRDHLSPQHLVDELFSRVGGAQGASVVKTVETVIRDHPLPMMLMGIGTAMWLGSGWRKALGSAGVQLSAMGTPTSASGGTAQPAHDLHAAKESLKENVASVGQSIADSAYQVLRSHASTKLDEYSKMANEGINTASEQLLHALEDQMDKTVETISHSMKKRPLAFSVLAIAVGAALGGVAIRDRR